MTDSLFGIIFGMILGSIGLLFFCVGFFMRRSDKALRAQASSVEGEVIEMRSSIVRDEDGDETTMYTPVFRVLDDSGLTVDLPANSSSNVQGHNVGDVKMVLRVPDADYVMLQEGGGMNFLTLMFMGMGALAMIVGVVVGLLVS